MGDRVKVTVELEPAAYAYLEVLAKHSGVAGQEVSDVLLHLAHSAADGMRRPGAWERNWLEQAFGDDWEPALEQVPDIPYAQLRPKKTE